MEKLPLVRVFSKIDGARPAAPGSGARPSPPPASPVPPPSTIHIYQSTSPHPHDAIVRFAFTEQLIHIHARRPPPLPIALPEAAQRSRRRPFWLLPPPPPPPPPPWASQPLTHSLTEPAPEGSDTRPTALDPTQSPAANQPANHGRQHPARLHRPPRRDGVVPQRQAHGPHRHPPHRRRREARPRHRQGPCRRRPPHCPQEARPHVSAVCVCLLTAALLVLSFCCPSLPFLAAGDAYRSPSYNPPRVPPCRYMQPGRGSRSRTKGRMDGQTDRWNGQAVEQPACTSTGKAPPRTPAAAYLRAASPLPMRLRASAGICGHGTAARLGCGRPHASDAQTYLHGTPGPLSSSPASTMSQHSNPTIDAGSSHPPARLVASHTHATALRSIAPSLARHLARPGRCVCPPSSRTIHPSVHPWRRPLPGRVTAWSPHPAPSSFVAVVRRMPP